MLRLQPYIYLIGLLSILFLGCASSQAGDQWETARMEMIDEIGDDVRATSSYLGKSALDERVLIALQKVPRDEFVPSDQKTLAYKNIPLPIGYGQTISQPYIVAIMTDLLQLKATDRVLEIGTGSGYQAAILAELTAEVYTIEIIKELADQAKRRLKQLGYNRIQARQGDGYYGWESAAPFDAIVVTAAADHVPPPLLKQLKPGGRIVIPVGGRFTVQQLVLIQRDQASKVTVRQILPVRFVPLTGGK